MTLEDDLRDALHTHAESIEPAADGLERIEARLPSTTGSPRLALRLSVAAMLLFVVGAVGAIAMRSDDADVAAVDPASTTPPTGVTGIENELAPLPEPPEDASTAGVDGGTPTQATPSDFEFPAAPGGVIGPRAASPEEAINGFLGLIQRGGEEVSFDLDGSLARVTRTFENGQVGDVTVLQLGSVELADGSAGVAVVQAISPRLVIESPSMLSTTSGTSLIVSGQGEGFEAVVEVDLYSSDDGVWLARNWASAGNFGVLGPFSVELPLSGGGPAWVVVQSSTGADTRLAPFSAVPIVLDATQAEPDFIVTNVPADDPDGGLVVRTLPGTDGDQVGVLPPDLSGIRKRSALSVFVGDGEPMYGEAGLGDGEEWWNVWVPEPLANGRHWGWVNSRHLAVDGTVATSDALVIADAFVAGLRGDDAAFASLSWSGDVGFGLSSDIQTTMGGKAALPEFWDTSFSFTPPPDYVGTLDGTLREILSPTRQALGPDTAVEIEVVSIDELSPYSNVNDELNDRFPGATVVRLLDPANDGSGWRIVSLFIEPGASGPEVAGIVGVEWVP